MTGRYGVIALSALSLVALGIGSKVEAQQPGLWLAPELPMSPQFDRGQPVSPFFEGWYQNPDGTYTLSFGYYNRNLREDIEIPIGADNFIEPAQFNGDQPTNFPAQPDYSIAGREWGVFSVVVPATFIDPGNDVVWTIKSKGLTFSVPGRVGNEAYQLQALDQPMGRGSFPPRLRLDPGGAEIVGLAGLTSTRTLSTSVGNPLSITVWASDNMAPNTRNPVAVTLTWFKHQGPVGGQVVFSEAEVKAPVEGGDASTTATFSAPGDYVLRVRVDNWSAGDSDDQRTCCWTNGYMKVTVTP